MLSICCDILLFYWCVYKKCVTSSCLASGQQNKTNQYRKCHDNKVKSVSLPPPLSILVMSIASVKEKISCLEKFEGMVSVQCEHLDEAFSLWKEIMKLRVIWLYPSIIPYFDQGLFIADFCCKCIARAFWSRGGLLVWCMCVSYQVWKDLRGLFWGACSTKPQYFLCKYNLCGALI